MTGAFFGAIAAFALNYIYIFFKNKKDKNKYMKILRSEIDFCLSILKRDTVQPLPTEKWTSLVNSGALKLFDADIELEPLSKSYQEIQYYNKSIKCYNAYVIEWDFVPDDFKEHAIQLQSKLKELIKFEWFR